MKYIVIGYLILLTITNSAHGTCVFRSDFGLNFTCNFKKSTLFRVRNLGGVKGYIGLGLSVGDELGLPESIGNLDPSRRRSINQRDYANTIGVLPASELPMTLNQQKSINRPHALKVVKTAQQLQDELQQKPAIQARMINKKSTMTEAISLPLGVPAFKPIPSYQAQINPQKNINRRILYEDPSSPAMIKNVQLISNSISAPNSNDNSFNIPAFQAMPSAFTKIPSTQINHLNGNSDIHVQPSYNVKREDSSNIKLTENEIKLPEVDLRGHTVEELAMVANVSVATIQAAIRRRQINLYYEQQVALDSQTSTTTLAHITAPITEPSPPPTTTYRPLRTTRVPTTPNYPSIGGKVMNAPREYYPVGYDKNFDDNFMSKVDLPATTFHCGDQKHFPGLYADVDLGCMVFHVCALTDDGLIMKSFLCPESTLFDQSVLKCNWWFYVDCKISKDLYDSNLPVSKSYQLMKALTFFSKYKNSQNETDSVDVEALKNSVTKKD